MSNVTDIILTCDSPLEDGGDDALEAAFERITEWLRASGSAPLEEVGQYAGGNATFWSWVWVGAVNNLDWEAFIAAVKASPWPDPESVQLLLKSEAAQHFRLIKLDLDPLTPDA